MDPRRDGVASLRRWRRKRRKIKAMKATSARNPSVVITAIAQCGKDDEPSEFCNPESPNPLPSGDVAVVAEVSVGGDDSLLSDASEDEIAAAEEADAAADDDDMAAKTDVANVVSGGTL